jgi:hypothetical protein
MAQTNFWIILICALKNVSGSITMLL